MNLLEKTKSIKIAEAVLKNVYIESKMKIWGGIPKEIKLYIRERLNYILNRRKKEDIKAEIIKTISWIDKNL